LIIGWEPEDQKNDPAYKNHASCCVLMISSFEPTFSTATDLRVRVSDLSGGSTVVFNGGWPGHSCVWCIPGGLVWWRAVKRLKRDSNFVESPQRTVRTQNAIIVTGIDKRTRNPYRRRRLGGKNGRRVPQGGESRPHCYAGA